MGEITKGLEIERKWLVEGVIPIGLNILEDSYRIWQGYLTTEPEVRVRLKKRNNDADSTYILTLKGEGKKVRPEIEYTVTESEFKALLEIGGLKDCQLIYKIQTLIKHGEHIIELNHVDIGTASEFVYAEVEFASEEEADAFVAPDWFGREITDEPQYKLKNYWKNTRLGGK